MSNDVVLAAKKRDIIGKKLASLREAGDAPAVVHDHGKDSMHITVPQTELKRVYHAAGKHGAIKLSIDNKQYTAMIKDVVYKPATSIITHVVFQSVSATETISAEVPVKLVGEIPAERASLLVVIGVDFVVIEALSKDLIDVLEVDASTLVEPGDKLHVSDIKAPSGVTITTEPEALVAHVETPKDQVAEADAASAELAAADAGAPADGEEATTEASEEE